MEHFVTASIHDAHEAVHKVKQYVCNTCNMVFKHQSVRDQHLVRHGQSARFVCITCGKQYLHRGDLAQHMKQQHSRGTAACTKYQCSDCDSAFPTARQLGYHSKVHKAKTIKCSQCNAKFCHYQERKRHVLNFH